jgi:hypothetical protein
VKYNRGKFGLEFVCGSGEGGGAGFRASGAASPLTPLPPPRGLLRGPLIPGRKVKRGRECNEVEGGERGVSLV